MQCRTVMSHDSSSRDSVRRQLWLVSTRSLAAPHNSMLLTDRQRCRWVMTSVPGQSRRNVKQVTLNWRMTLTFSWATFTSYSATSMSRSVCLSVCLWVSVCESLSVSLSACVANVTLLHVWWQHVLNASSFVFAGPYPASNTSRRAGWLADIACFWLNYTWVAPSSVRRPCTASKPRTVVAASVSSADNIATHDAPLFHRIKVASLKSSNRSPVFC